MSPGSPQRGHLFSQPPTRRRRGHWGEAPQEHVSHFKVRMMQDNSGSCHHFWTLQVSAQAGGVMVEFTEKWVQGRSGVCLPVMAAIG